MKYYKIIGIISCLLLIISCFLPWTFYSDLNKSFSGFFSEQNVYGRPGKVFIFFAVVSAILVLIDRLWAKRTLLFTTAITVAYLIRTYVLYTTCVNTICPENEYGIYLLILSVVGLAVTALFPDMRKIPLKKE